MNIHFVLVMLSLLVRVFLLALKTHDLEERIEELEKRNGVDNENNR